MIFMSGYPVIQSTSWIPPMAVPQQRFPRPVLIEESGIGRKELQEGVTTFGLAIVAPIAVSARALVNEISGFVSCSMRVNTIIQGLMGSLLFAAQMRGFYQRPMMAILSHTGFLLVFGIFEFLNEIGRINESGLTPPIIRMRNLAAIVYVSALCRLSWS
jgi:hypothetical protein